MGYREPSSVQEPGHYLRTLSKEPGVCQSRRSECSRTKSHSSATKTASVFTTRLDTYARGREDCAFYCIAEIVARGWLPLHCHAVVRPVFSSSLSVCCAKRVSMRMQDLTDLEPRRSSRVGERSPEDSSCEKQHRRHEGG